MPPDYIVNNWTNELLDVMVEKLIERKSMGKKPVMSEELFFKQAGIKVVKKHGD